MKKLRIAAFGGFRSIPPKAGAAGSDKFAFDLYPRIVKRGHSLIAYSRIYPGDKDNLIDEFEGVKIKYLKTVNKAGFDTLLHSAKATFDVIFHNTADQVHLHVIMIFIIILICLQGLVQVCIKKYIGGKAA